ncbi:MAG: hypothetical protein LBG89_01365 [Rickettsiales bacterium]|jgi:hypothetical protein|nr:hypothetical protein [Rickettsiales bacterium]
MSEKDEIFQFIQNTNARLNDPARQQALRAAQTPQPAPETDQVQNLAPEQIVSEVYIMSPSQLELVIDYTARNVAIGMNIKSMFPLIKRLTDKAMKEALAKTKRMGARKK